MRGSATHAAIASAVNHTVKLPRWRRLAQAGIVSEPVRHPALLARNVMAAVLVQLEGQDGHPEFGRVIPYVTRPFTTTARSMHHANIDGFHTSITSVRRRYRSTSLVF